jgi:hypothetical protein
MPNLTPEQDDERLNAIADQPHTCRADYRVRCWACEAASLINQFGHDTRHLLKRYDAEHPKKP